MCWALRFGFGMGVVLINAFQVFEVIVKFPQLKFCSILPYFRGGNPTTLRLKRIITCQRYSHQALDMRIRQWGCPIFTAKNLVRYGASTRFHVYVYGTYRHARNMMSRRC